MIYFGAKKVVVRRRFGLEVTIMMVVVVIVIIIIITVRPEHEVRN